MVSGVITKDGLSIGEVDQYGVCRSSVKANSVCVYSVVHVTTVDVPECKE